MATPRSKHLTEAKSEIYTTSPPLLSKQELLRLQEIIFSKLSVDSKTLDNNKTYRLSQTEAGEIILSKLSDDNNTLDNNKTYRLRQTEVGKLIIEKHSFFTISPVEIAALQTSVKKLDGLQELPDCIENIEFKKMNSIDHILRCTFSVLASAIIIDRYHNKSSPKPTVSFENKAFTSSHYQALGNSITDRQASEMLSLMQMRCMTNPILTDLMSDYISTAISLKPVIKSSLYRGIVKRFYDEMKNASDSIARGLSTKNTNEEPSSLAMDLSLGLQKLTLPAPGVPELKSLARSTKIKETEEEVNRAELLMKGALAKSGYFQAKIQDKDEDIIKPGWRSKNFFHDRTEQNAIQSIDVSIFDHTLFPGQPPLIINIVFNSEELANTWKKSFVKEHIDMLPTGTQACAFSSILGLELAFTQLVKHNDVISKTNAESFIGKITDYVAKHRTASLSPSPSSR